MSLIINKFRLALVAVTLLAVAGAAEAQRHQDTVGQAVDHAGHWTSNRVNAPHKYKSSRRRHRRHVKAATHKDTVRHATEHAGNWISHHVNAPHHTPPPNK